VNYPLTPIGPDTTIDAVRFQMGFRDGQRSMMRGCFCDDTSYLTGFNAGLKFYRCSIPAVAEGSLERGWGEELLNEV